MMKRIPKRWLVVGVLTAVLVIWIVGSAVHTNLSKSVPYDRAVELTLAGDYKGARDAAWECRLAVGSRQEYRDLTALEDFLEGENYWERGHYETAIWKMRNVSFEYTQPEVFNPMVEELRAKCEVLAEQEEQQRKQEEAQRPKPTPKPSPSPKPSYRPAQSYAQADDPYDAGDYDDPEDFYEDYYDDFDGFEDAEDYWDDWAD